MARVKGSTIIETVVAMTIILMVFAATITIFANSSQGYNQPLQVKAIVLVGNEIEQIKLTRTIQIKSIENDNILIEKKVEHVPNSDCIVLHIKAKRIDNDKTVLQRRLLFFKHEISSILDE